MTLLEKAMEINSEKGEPSNENNIIDCTCTSDYGLEAPRECKNDGIKHCECEKCWNREMPGTEPLTENERKIDFMSENAYNKGLNDAWELAKKCVDLEGRGEDNELMFKIFNTVFLKQLFNDNTPQEALAKLKAYEEAQSKIDIGDVVDVYGDIVVVSSLGTDKDRYHVLFKDGITNIYGKTIPIKKTGKHLDISSILEQIGE